MKKQLLGLVTFLVVALNVNAQIELIQNGTFASGATGWTTSGNWYVTTSFTCYDHETGYAYAGNSSGQAISNETGDLKQTIFIPSTATSATLSFGASKNTDETSTTTIYDYVNVYLLNSSGTQLMQFTPTNINNLYAGVPSTSCDGYSPKSFSIPSTYFGQSIQIDFLVHTDGSSNTMFRIDDVSLLYTAGTTCSYSISPSSVSPLSSAGSGSVIVTATSGCSWTAVSNSTSWLTVTSGSSGSGNGSVGYSYTANTTGSSRTGTITIAGYTFTVTQAGTTSCSYSISPSSVSPASSTGSGSVSVTATSGCNWTAVSNNTSWLTVTSGSSGTGNGTVGYSYTANTTSSSRTGTITIAGYTFTVTQAGTISSSIYGVDISSLNGTISWPTVYSAGKSFAYVRASKGIGPSAGGSCWTDPSFSSNMTSTNPGVVLGAYHVCLPEDNAALDEANYFYGVSQSYIGNGFLPPALDLEDPSTSSGHCNVATTPLDVYYNTAALRLQLAQWVNTWCNRVYTLTGKWPVLYADRCDVNLIVDYYTNGTINSNIKLWIADYPATAGSPVGSTACSPSNSNWNTWPWIFHQYFDPGTAGNDPNTDADPGMDQDIFNGGTTAFNNLINATSQSATITNVTISPSTVCPCGTFTITYTINASTSMTLMLGASIMPTGTTNYISDVTNDVKLTVPAGTSTQTRSFTVPCGTATGAYDMLTALWQDVNGDNTIDNGDNELGSLQSTGILTVGGGTPGSVSVSGAGSYCGSTTLTASGGTGGIIYWQGTTSGGTSTAQASSSQIVSASGTYYFNAENSCGWGTQGSATVTINSSPVPSISGTPTGCSLVSLTATGGTLYSWSGGISPGNGTNTFSSSGTYVVTVTNGNNCTASASQAVTVNFPPTPGITGTPTGCGLVSLTATGGTGYAWSGGNSPGNAANTFSSSGNYRVTVTNSNNCTASAQQTVTVNSSPVPGINGTASGCNLVSLTAIGGNSYAWSGGNSPGTAANSFSNSGNYTVTVTNSNNCTASQSQFVTIYPPPTAGIIGTTTACGSVSLTATGGTLYAWNGGNSPNTAVNTFNSSGNYSVTVTNSNNCTATVTVTATISAAPTANIINLSNNYCSSAPQVTLTGTPANGTFSVDGNTATTLNPATIGLGLHTVTYTVTQGGCSDTASQTVTISQSPAATITYNSALSFCQNDSVILTATQGTGYAWSNGPTSQSIIVKTAGNYYVLVTNPGGCSGVFSSDTLQISVNPIPTVTITPSSGSIQPGESDTLIASGGGSYTWSNSGTTSSIIVAPANTTLYTVTGTLNGCSASANATVNVISQNCSFTVSPVTVTVDSNGNNQSITVTVNSGNNCSWSATTTGNCPWLTIGNGSGTGSGTFTIDIPATTDTATQTCQVNVSGTGQTITVTQTGRQGSVAACANPISTPQLQINGCSLSINALANVVYQWYYDTIALSNTNSNTLQANDGNGPYYVEVTSLLNTSCTARSASITINCPSGLDELQGVQNLSIVPNPSPGLFIINFEVNHGKQIQVKIYDLIGNLIQAEEPVEVVGTYSKQINLGNVAKGVYILQIQSDGGSLNRKIEID